MLQRWNGGRGIAATTVERWNRDCCYNGGTVEEELLLQRRYGGRGIAAFRFE